MAYNKPSHIKRKKRYTKKDYKPSKYKPITKGKSKSSSSGLTSSQKRSFMKKQNMRKNNPFLKNQKSNVFKRGSKEYVLQTYKHKSSSGRTYTKTREVPVGGYYKDEYGNTRQIVKVGKGRGRRHVIVDPNYSPRLRSIDSGGTTYSDRQRRKKEKRESSEDYRKQSIEDWKYKQEQLRQEKLREKTFKATQKKIDRDRKKRDIEEQREYSEQKTKEKHEEYLFEKREDKKYREFQDEKKLKDRERRDKEIQESYAKEHDRMFEKKQKAYRKELMKKELRSKLRLKPRDVRVKRRVARPSFHHNVQDVVGRLRSYDSQKVMKLKDNIPTDPMRRKFNAELKSVKSRYSRYFETKKKRFSMPSDVNFSLGSKSKKRNRRVKLFEKKYHDAFGFNSKYKFYDTGKKLNLYYPKKKRKNSKKRRYYKNKKKGNYRRYPKKYNRKRSGYYKKRYRRRRY